MKKMVFFLWALLMALVVPSASAFTYNDGGGDGGGALSNFVSFHFGPVSIITPPQSHTAAIGSTTSFTVVAEGGPNTSYQWIFNGKKLIGQTEASLVLPNVRAANVGQYTVVMQNEYPAVKSSATLKVVSPARIVRPPKDIVVNSNATVTFNVGATGSALQYQWQLDGNDLPGATKAKLTLARVLATNAGVYTVIVSNVASSTNASATLTVRSSPLDLNSNGFTDLLLRHETDSAWGAWLMNGANVAKTLKIGTTNDPSLRFVGLNDFDGDGQKDIVLQGEFGAVSVVPVKGTNFLESYVIDRGTEWWWERPRRLPSFDVQSLEIVDGRPPDPLWQILVAHAMGNVTQDWKIRAVADFNADGQGDLLAQNDNGSVAVWFLNGTNFISGTPTYLSETNSASNWQIVGTGDFNGDGKPDILWQDDSGYLYVWFMDGTTFLSGANLLDGKTIGTAWKVVAVADFNGDGQTDLIVENNRGVVAVKFLNGTELIGGKVLRGGLPLGSHWQIVGPK